MTPEQRLAVFNWLREAADKIGLADWSITVDADPPDDDGAWAETEPIGPYLRAGIRVESSVLLESDHDIARSLLHELCHLYHGDMRERVAKITAHIVEDEAMQKLLDEEVMSYVERIVDQVAVQYTKLLHLPSMKPIHDATKARLHGTQKSIDAKGGPVE